MKAPHALFASVLISATTMAQENPAVRVGNLQAVAGVAPPISAIVGTATNTTDRQLSHVFVQFNLYEANNALVGNAIDEVADLAPGITWKFKADVAKPYDHFALSKVTVY